MTAGFSTLMFASLASLNRMGFFTALAIVLALIFATPAEVDPGSSGLTLPNDCLKPLYLADLTTPKQENRIDILQVDDTEVIRENTYWDAEIGGALQIGNLIHLFKGDSATHPTSVILTYLRRPVDFTADADTLAVSEGRLGEEYFGLIRSGMLRRAAMHLQRREEMEMAGEDMNARLQAIQEAWDISQQWAKEDQATR